MWRGDLRRVERGVAVWRNFVRRREGMERERAAVMLEWRAVKRGWRRGNNRLKYERSTLTHNT